ncbi:MAG: aldose 1-epimerase family protein [Candidatus Dormibacteria bacterium]
MSYLPSGLQHELRAGAARAVAVEVGGGLREYTVAGRHLLDGYGEHEICAGARGQLLVPWPNRVRDGRYASNDRVHQLALTEPEQHNAIHGLVRFAAWRLEDRDTARIRLSHTLHPQPGYPHSLLVGVEYHLTETALQVSVEVSNRGDSTAPVGVGAHPYLRAGGGQVDDWTLHLPAGRRLVTDAQQVPLSDVPVAGSPEDFRSPRRIGVTHLDTGYSELSRDTAGSCRVEVRAKDGGGVALVLGADIPYVMAFTGDTLADVSRRRQGLGLEPMTCAPDAFNSGQGLRTLGPGETLRCGWRLEAISPD